MSSSSHCLQSILGNQVLRPWLHLSWCCICFRFSDGCIIANASSMSMSGIPFLTLAASYFYNRWVFRFAEIIIQAVAVVFYRAPAIKPYRPAIAPTLGMAFIGNAIYSSSLLSKCKQMGTTGWRVVPVVPGATVNAKSRNIRARSMLCIVACLTLGKFHIPRFRHGVVPFLLRVGWCRH
jgi:hypothetical protein